MNPQCILIHYHEIGLKGDNRSWFEKIFINNIKIQISNLPCRNIQLKAARVLILGIDPLRYDEYKKKLKNVMGLKHAYLMSITKLDQNDINLEVQKQVEKNNFSTFRISTKRQDKQFHLTSQDVNNLIGANVVKTTSKSVNLDNPDLNIIIELVNGKAYIGYKKIIGYGGLPVGTGERALSLISSGIDSPVASFLLLKRGVTIDYIHFHSAPSTSKQSINNVRKILLKLSKYQMKCNLYNIPLLEIQQKIMANSIDKYWVILFRRAMYSISKLLAKNLSIDALITGENIGQVASQTISNIRAASDTVDIPVLRPLAGMNKEDIIRVAIDIETYNISIEPHEDCCSFFVPIHPATSANIETIRAIDDNLDLGKSYHELIKNVKAESISIYE